MANPVTFDEILPAIMAGRPESFSTAAAAFDTVLDTLETLSANISNSVHGVIGSGGSWTGPASTAFGGVASGLVSFVEETTKPLSPYGGVMTDAGDALATAQSEIQEYASWVQSVRSAQPRTVSEETINAGAQAILERLASAYRSAGGRLAPIPATPADVAGDGDGGSDGGDASDTGSDGGDATDTGPVDTPSGEDGIAPVGSYSPLGGVPGTFAGGSAASGYPGLPSFALTSGYSDPSTILTGLPGPVGATLSLPPMPSPTPHASMAQGSFLPGFAGGFAGSPTPGGAGTGSQRRSVLTSVGRLPGLGSEGYADPPATRVTVRSGSVPPLWSQYGPAGSDRRRERTTSLIGDEDWTDPADVDGAIGRPGTPQ